jgi:hypothetical protein
VANGGNGVSTAGQSGEKHLGWQIFSQSIVVILGLAAVVVSLALILDAYDVKEDVVTATTTAQQDTGLTGNSNQSGEQNGGGPTGPDGSSPTRAAVPVAATSPASEAASVSSSSVVSILTPIMAGIVGIAGLFFGISATGSARGRQAGTDQTVADTSAKATDASAKAVDLVTEVRQQESPNPPTGGTQPPQGDDF